MSPPGLEHDRHRRGLRRRIRRLPGRAVLFAEVGAGLGWVLAKHPDARRSRRRSRADLEVAPLTADGPESPMQSLLTAWIEADPLSRHPLEAADLDALARAADGLPGFARSMARGAARFGVRRFLEAYHDGSWDPPDTTVAAVEAELEARLRGLDGRVRAGWSALCLLPEWLARADARAVSAVTDQDLDALAERGLVRAVGSTESGDSKGSEHAALRVPRPLARLAARGRLGASVTVRKRVASWGARLHEEAQWLGRAASLHTLRRQRATFAALAHDADREVRAQASAAWVVAAASSEEREWAEGRALDVTMRLEPSASGATELAILLAERTRVAGHRGAMSSLLTRVRAEKGHEDGRAFLVAARAHFNEGEAARARQLLRRVLARAPEDDPPAAAGAHLTLAHVERDLGDAAAAYEAADRAIELFDALGGERWRAETFMSRALIDLGVGRPGNALASLEKARLEHIDPERRGAWWSFRALAHELAGDYPAALAAVERALGSGGSPLFTALWRVYAGRIALGLDQPDDAAQHLERAVRSLGGSRTRQSSSTALALLAVARAEGGEDPRAPLEEARTLATAPDRVAIVRLLAGVTALLERGALRAGRPARAFDTDWTTEVAPHGPAPVGQLDSLHLRCAAQLVERVRSRHARRVAAHETVVIDEDQRAVAYRGLRIDLAGRPLLWRVLGVLHGAAPMSVADDALVGRVWPDERLVGASGRNRLRVAISHLRKLGLRGAIERHAGGYRMRQREITSAK